MAKSFIAPPQSWRHGVMAWAWMMIYDAAISVFMSSSSRDGSLWSLDPESWHWHWHAAYIAATWLYIYILYITLDGTTMGPIYIYYIYHGIMGHGVWRDIRI
jgi:hypothetical protein